MNLILPQELLDLIVAHVGDKDALKACSLVCHAFLNSSRTHLFHTITFSDRRYLPTVIAFWTTSAHLYAYIQVVRLSLEWSQPAALPQFEALLKPFIHFPIQIHFHSSAGSGLPGFGSITEYFADAGTRSKLSNAITYVRSEDWSLRSPLAFTAFPNLKALSIRGPSWPIADDTGLYSFARYPPENFRLDELELGCQITPMTLSWLEQSILHSQLRTLKLNNGCSGGSVRSGYTRFNNLLRCVARTLHTFSFEPSPEVPDKHLPTLLPRISTTSKTHLLLPSSYTFRVGPIFPLGSHCSLKASFDQLATRNYH
ncbi:hypothetical protein BDN72DRAFT_64209 [Pluteus cervinus]|uniref:Uncharacterized protein n=1 Tax=Pluteus cervinus TaxID=181527 RepID=A0ACD3AQT1_9AGAR|nr:hypothetical protein BDN72DRAFT_64209 [Pluteus cervinus]